MEDGICQIQASLHVVIQARQLVSFQQGNQITDESCIVHRIGIARDSENGRIVDRKMGFPDAVPTLRADAAMARREDGAFFTGMNAYLYCVL